MYMCNYCKYTMPTFKEKSEVDDTRVKSRRDDDLGPKTGWNFRYEPVTVARLSPKSGSARHEWLGD
jgi:hypothetical protein